jgi:phosphatidylglycerophosphate synthase
VDANVIDEGWTVPAALDALRSAQKPPHNTPAYSRFVNRPLGRQLAARAVRIGLTPNSVSALSAACSLAAVALLVSTTATVVVALLIAALLVLGYALDSADGQVARLTGLGSPFGEWLDHMIDCAKGTSLHLAVAVHAFRFMDVPVAWLLVPLGYCLVESVLFFGMVLTDHLRRGSVTGGPTKEGSLSVTRSLLLLPSDFGALAVVFASLAWPFVFTPLYTLMFGGYAVLLLAALIQWSRQLRALDAGRSS